VLLKIGTIAAQALDDLRHEIVGRRRTRGHAHHLRTGQPRVIDLRGTSDEVRPVA
jgi:hypothetical protein